MPTISRKLLTRPMPVAMLPSVTPSEGDPCETNNSIRGRAQAQPVFCLTAERKGRLGSSVGVTTLAVTGR